MQDLKLDIEGMSCGGCVRNVTGALEGVPGVQVRNVAVGSADVSIDPAKTSPDDVKRAVEKRGFQVRQVS
jgi:copper chaperone